MVGLLMLTLLASPVAAQSLGDIARRESARRETAPKGKVYTNESLPAEAPSVPPKRSSSTVQAAPADAPAAADAAPAAGAPAQGDAAKAQAEPADPKEKSGKGDPKKDEKEWRDRIAKARESLQRNQSFAEALQSRINALSTDFVNRDDPAQRTVIASDREKALAELDRVRRDIQNDEKAIAAIREEARREGVPAGWLR
jgi:hypothetical protein